MKIILALLFSLILITPAMAQTRDPRAAEVARAQAYLQSLKTVKARFVQTAPDGHRTTGTFYLSRPGKLRFEYDAPVKDFVVADGVFIYFYDGQLNQQSNAPIGETLADFLLRRNLKLGGDVTVTNVVMPVCGYCPPPNECKPCAVGPEKNILQISLAQTSDPKAGQLTLFFSAWNELQLTGWRVVDATGAVTDVTLSDLQKDIKLPGSLFVYKNPHFGSEHFNQ